MTDSPFRAVPAQARPAPGKVHALGWPIATLLAVLAFGVGDAATVAWSAGLVSGGVLVATAVGLAFLAVFILVTVWIMETK